MNSYLNELSRLLVNALSAEEYNNVMQYYTEYFADAGVENEAEVIKELGSPEELASKIISEYQDKQPEEQPQSQSHNQSIQPDVVVNNSHVEAPKPARKRLAGGWIVLIVFAGIFVVAFVMLLVLKIGKSTITQEYKVVDEFTSIQLTMDVADVEIISSEEFAIEYVLSDDADVSVKNGVLEIDDSWSDGIFFGIPSSNADTYVKIYVPDDAVVNVEMEVDVGDIAINGIKMDNLEIYADIGDVNINTDSLDGDFTIEADIGDVSIKGFLACDIYVYADMGEIQITSYYKAETYEYTIETDMGQESVNKNGGVELEDKLYNVTLEADMGDVTMTFCDN